MKGDNKISHDDILNARYNNAVALKQFSAAKYLAKRIHDSITMDLDPKKIDEIIFDLDILRKYLISKKDVTVLKPEVKPTHDINKMDGNKLRSLIEIYEKSDQKTKEKMNKEYPGLSDII